MIASIGAGYAKTNNYYALKKRTFEDGTTVYNSDSTLMQNVVETVTGAIGTLTVTEGLASFVEAYIPLIRRDDGIGSIYFGNRITFYGIGKTDRIVNATTGIYFAFKDRSNKKDLANFAITGQFNQLQKRASEDYFKNNFSVLFQAAVPIRFN